MTKALDKTYDAIVIGAGHHGLILGSYLARAGLDVLLVERRLTYGGGLSTREVTLPASITISIRSIISTSARRRGSATSASPTESPTSRRATSSARRTATGPRWCSDATSRRPSPTSEDSRRAMPPRSASGTHAPKPSRRRF